MTLFSFGWLKSTSEIRGAPKETVRYGRRATDGPPTVARIRKMYERPTSFTNLLPWLEYDPETQAFLLDDGCSLGALFELRAAGTEARPQAWLQDFRDKLQTVLTGAIPESQEPWILQVYVQDEARLDRLVDEIERYARNDARKMAFSKTWFGILREHLRDISRPGGLFLDELVTGGPWQGRQRRVRAVLYRRRPPGPLPFSDPTAEQELNDVAGRLVTALESAGISARRCGGADLYYWLFRWLNPHPPTTDGDTEALLKLAPYPGDAIEERPYGYDFAEQLMLGLPSSDPERGLWWFDGLPHRAITVQGLTQIPGIGQIGLERRIGDHVFSVFDRMPEHTVMAMTITIQAQDEIRNHLVRIERAAFGDYAEAKLAGEDAKQAQIWVAKGNKIFPVQTVFYVRGDDEADLQAKVNRVNSLLMANNIRPIHERQDLCALDSYIRNLPMAYDPKFDRREIRRSRFMFSRHIAHLLPLYGRSTGTGHPGMLFFNRGGEPLTFDPLNLHDRKKNAHALIVGPTGAGKSAMLCYLILHVLAVHRPRIFLVEVGNSFGLLGQYLQAQGFSVKQVMISPSADVSLPPFADALKLLDPKRKRRLDLALVAERDSNDDEETELEDDDRDILGEMEISARIMITGGDIREDNRLTRADRLLIREAMLEASKNVSASGRDQVLPEDVVKALRGRRDLAERRAERAQDMADALALFCSPGSIEAHLFNRPGRPWPEVDVTLVDLGILAREDYQDKLTVAYVGLMNHINALVERTQHDHRPTLVITDEGHIITTNPLLAPYVIKITKMWRKLGAWFWIATQNLEDFPDASRRMLTMLEWWLCLVMPKDEINQIARFRDLSEEQKALLLAARKSPGQYVEGVVLTDQLAALFRNVPPPIALALAMTEKDEKAQRAELMKQHGCSELEAALMIAERIAAKRGTT
ncbi:conjugative transfer ATPase [Methylocaldum sp. 14B]|uniref:conjugative transfer ATPase n=1 Tax=Methylocaldum sp. 14B TaxID=1912213 RepID=UPI00098A8D24|nr:conjugative transfer ATPase [Methylocaldum sp. 14B]